DSRGMSVPRARMRCRSAVDMSIGPQASWHLPRHSSWGSWLYSSSSWVYWSVTSASSGSGRFDVLPSLQGGEDVKKVESAGGYRLHWAHHVLDPSEVLLPAGGRPAGGVHSGTDGGEATAERLSFTGGVDGQAEVEGSLGKVGAEVLVFDVG